MIDHQSTTKIAIVVRLAYRSHCDAAEVQKSGPNRDRRYFFGSRSWRVRRLPHMKPVPSAWFLSGAIQPNEGSRNCVAMTLFPTAVKRELFASATKVTEPLPTARLKEQIARFLHSHKDLMSPEKFGG